MDFSGSKVIIKISSIAENIVFIFYSPVTYQKTELTERDKDGIIGMIE